MRKKDNYMSLKKKWSVFMITVMSNYATPHPNPFQVHQVTASHKNLNIVTKQCLKTATTSQCKNKMKHRATFDIVVTRCLVISKLLPSINKPATRGNAHEITCLNHESNSIL